MRAHHTFFLFSSPLLPTLFFFEGYFAGVKYPSKKVTSPFSNRGRCGSFVFSALLSCLGSRQTLCLGRWSYLQGHLLWNCCIFDTKLDTDGIVCLPFCIYIVMSINIGKLLSHFLFRWCFCPILSPSVISCRIWGRSFRWLCVNNLLWVNFFPSLVLSPGRSSSAAFWLIHSVFS